MSKESIAILVINNIPTNVKAIWQRKGKLRNRIIDLPRRYDIRPGNGIKFLT